MEIGIYITANSQGIICFYFYV